LVGRRGVSGWQHEENGGDLLSLVQSLRTEVEELLETFEALPARVTDLDSRLHEIGRAMREVEVQVVHHDASVRDMTSLIKRLGARVEWLERNIRLQSDLAEAALDDVGPEEVRLAAVAEAGHRAQYGLLTAAARSALESAVHAHATAVRHHVQHRESALEACQDLAGTDWKSAQHAAAVQRFQQSAADTGQAYEALKRLADPALAARRQLDDDEQQHRSVADVLADGEQAWTRLNELLRDRVADAVGAGALLPSWFTGVLGPIPPVQDTRRWMDGAIALLAYRVTYAISDPMLALGTAPAQDAGPRQRHWYEQLTRQLRELQT
jgi:chromosome segregation ATPase